MPWRGQQAGEVLDDEGGGSGHNGGEDADAPLLPAATRSRRARQAAQRGKSAQQPSSAEKGASGVVLLMSTGV